MLIRILGIENNKLKTLENSVKKSLVQTGMNADIKIVSQIDDILSYDISGIPALLFDETVIASEEVPTEDFLVRQLQCFSEKKH